MGDRRRRIAVELSKSLSVDANVEAVALCPQSASEEIQQRRPLELMVVVSRMPFDLDMTGIKSVEVDELTVRLFHITPDRLRTAINDEAGCWLFSGRVLYSETLHDRNGVLLELRKAVNSVPIKSRLAAFEIWFKEARAFPTIALNRGISTEHMPEMILLRDNAALAKALFILNGKPPRSEATLMDDVMKLEHLPSGFQAISQILGNMDRLDLKKFEKARKEYNEMTSDLRRISRILRTQ